MIRASVTRNVEKNVYHMYIFDYDPDRIPNNIPVCAVITANLDNGIYEWDGNEWKELS